MLYIFSLGKCVGGGWGWGFRSISMPLATFLPLPSTKIYWSFFPSFRERCPVARNTSEMGISCSLGQQGLHTAPAWDRNSHLRQGEERRASGRGIDFTFPWGL